jgi:nitronate monooxygenase
MSLERPPPARSPSDPCFNRASVAIRTPFTELLGLTYPLALAPMGVVAGGELASAVSNAGGLGVVGGGYGDLAWLERELEIVSTRVRGNWGAGLITWSATPESVQLVLSYRPAVVFLSFGDPAGHAQTITDAGCLLICQVQDVDEARDAVALGAHVIVAQGTEAGGHGALRATLPLVPSVVDAVAPTPVLAAGGIGDGRGVAAALALGAAGAVLGTRFCVAKEALLHPRAQQRLLSARGGETLRTRVFDIVRNIDWPAPYTGRALENRFLRQWQGSEMALSEDGGARERYRVAAEEADFDTAFVWAGECVDLLDRVEPAATIVDRIGAEAEAWLLGAQALVS